MTDLDEFRAEKDAYFRDDPSSPLPPELRAAFTGLRYYPEQPALQLAITPELLDEPEPVELQTSTGDAAPYVRWARIRFEVDGRPAVLTVYRDPHAGHLFLPFVDVNAGGETYGAGRYVDVVPLPDGQLLVDFNYAYNPYCAYSPYWSCPIPPAENRLDVAIRAGEQAFEAH